MPPSVRSSVRNSASGSAGSSNSGPPAPAAALVAGWPGPALLVTAAAGLDAASAEGRALVEADGPDAPWRRALFGWLDGSAAAADGSPPTGPPTGPPAGPPTSSSIGPRPGPPPRPPPGPSADAAGATAAAGAAGPAAPDAPDAGRPVRHVSAIPQDGATRLVEWTAVALPDNTVALLGRDVTLERAVHGALVDSRRRLRALVDLAGDLAFEVDGNGDFAFLTPDRVLGRSADALIGRSAETLLAEPGLARTPFEARRPVAAAPVVLADATGRPVPARIAARPILDAAGGWAGARGLVRFDRPGEDSTAGAAADPAVGSSAGDPGAGDPGAGNPGADNPGAGTTAEAAGARRYRGPGAGDEAAGDGPAGDRADDDRRHGERRRAEQAAGDRAGPPGRPPDGAGR